MQPSDSTAFTWSDRHWSELDAATLYQVLALRNAVFVVEQDCPYQDVDGLDLVGSTRHLLAHDSAGALVGYARLLGPDGPGTHGVGPEGPAPSGSIWIGRVIVADTARGTGLGHELLERAVAAGRAAWPDAPMRLAAQSHLVGYYGRAGFEPEGAEYIEDDIPHQDMYLPGS